MRAVAGVHLAYRLHHVAATWLGLGLGLGFGLGSGLALTLTLTLTATFAGRVDAVEVDRVRGNGAPFPLQAALLAQDVLEGDLVAWLGLG